jgi:hypothetical protein
MKKPLDKKPRKKGGDAIADGAYGCVFSPRLKCGSDCMPVEVCRDAKAAENFISKLMEKDDAITEYKKITNFKPILDDIPNSKDYFLVDDISICTPDPDISKFRKSMDEYDMCRDFIYVMDKPKDYKIINMLDGGGGITKIL